MDNGFDVIARDVVEKPFNNPISIPATMDATNATFAAKPSTVILGGHEVDAFGYGVASILGPTLKTQQGATVNLTFMNQLSEPTNIHWHGLEVPATQDGYPTDLTHSGGVLITK